MNSRGAALALAVTLTLGACAKQQSEPEAAEAASAAPQADDAVAPMGRKMDRSAAEASAPAAAPLPVGALESSALDPTSDGERRFIRRADATFDVRDVYRSALAIEDLVAAHGGFVTRNSINAQVQDVQTRPIGDGELLELATYMVRGELQLRLPTARTQVFLRDLAKQIEFLHARNFTAQDAQFELLRRKLAQARNEQAQRAQGESLDDGGRLRDRTTAIDARTQAQLARDEARVEQRIYEDQIAFSTIDLAMNQAPQLRRSTRVDIDAALRQAGPSFFARVGQSLAAGWNGLLTAVVALTVVWPLWLLVAAVLGVYLWWRRRQG